MASREFLHLSLAKMDPHSRKQLWSMLGLLLRPLDKTLQHIANMLARPASPNLASSTEMDKCSLQAYTFLAQMYTDLQQTLEGFGQTVRKQSKR
mmetsp:Transcript_75028/g.119237  ORF Transcript_75028/g.119237 Transcript_75028/m.119237 type:complete len:94 (-) Transcript_75028:25-306(-)